MESPLKFKSDEEEHCGSEKTSKSSRKASQRCRQARKELNIDEITTDTLYWTCKVQNVNMSKD
ncbi:hypothetical protein H5410_033520 [Solanum commersonii]|uniref:Uncharacterized protein n=1 Tax=Solanum commersonii TaxID=4109 RepID=A0A9J5YTD0_SOLCO|nr:hypothetical protein H5410_033520 [Solanum commersonii]